MNKSVVLILVIGLLVTWLLASSVGVLMRLNESGGSRMGGLLGIHVELPQPVITLPQINITIPQHVSTPRAAELYIPLVPLPIIMPNIQINMTMHVMAITTKQPTAVSTKSTSAKGVGLGQQYSGNALVPLRVPPLLIIIAVVAALIIASVGSLVMVRRYNQNARLSNGHVGISSVPRTPTGSVNSYESPTKSPMEVELLPGEVVRRMGGWGGNPIIDLGVPRDLPLIWGVNEPLPISVKDGVQVTVAEPGLLQGDYLIMPSRGCYSINARLGDVEEHLVVRAGDYGDDVIKFLRLNIGDFNVKDSATIREVMSKLVGDGIVNGDWSSINTIIGLFERVRYGLRGVGRRDYEEFLRALGRVFRDAKVIVCEGSP